MKSIIFNNNELINQYKNGVHIYLYGCGTYSKIVQSELESFGIRIEANIVDDEFYNKNVYFDERWSSLNNLDSNRIVKRSELSNFDFKFSVVNAINGKFEIFDYVNCLSTFFVDGMLGGAWSVFNNLWLEQNHDKIKSVKELLDNDSVKIFEAFINRRLNFTNDSESFTSKPIYFNDLIDFNNKHVVVDCGAYTGDNLLSFLELNTESTYICFEPDPKNYSEIMKLVDNQSLKNVIAYNLGVSDKKETVKFKSNQGLTSLISDDGDSEISVDSIDNLIDLAVTIIKMDIEGEELKALKGARNLIQKYNPYLLISLYHKPSDLYSIPLYINSLSNKYDYKLMQHYTGPSSGTPLTDLVLYCIPKNI